MPDSDYVKGLQAADQVALRMAAGQFDRPNAAMILGWLHTEICKLIYDAREADRNKAFCAIGADGELTD